MAESVVTIVGNVTRDLELKFLNGGQAAVRFDVAVNRKWVDKKTSEDREQVSYFTVVAYGKFAENVAASVHKGHRVIVHGRLEQRSWETEEEPPQKRSVVEIVAEAVGPDLRFVTYEIHRAERQDSSASPSRSAGNVAPRAPRVFDDDPF